MIGKTVSHYKILEKLGEGGMGEIFLAKDTRLERKVALKFLPLNMTSNKDARKRFEREAKAAAALNHPNIVTVYEIDEFAGQIYIAMEYVEGETLQAKLFPADEAASPEVITIEDVVDIALQVCEGLEASHQTGIVHRDIKLQNIILDKSGRVKILDFGLAKLKGASKITGQLCRMGTIYYMSPEQVQGEELDRRTDIWSLGVVLYEIITGQVPFKGEAEPAVVHAILDKNPEPVTNLRPGVPPALGGIVNKCLEKPRHQRYQQMDPLEADLRQLKEDIRLGKRQTRPVTATNGKISKTFFRTLKLPGMIMMAIILVMLSYFVFKPGNGIKERITIVVVDCVNETGEKELNSLSGLLITKLEQSRHLSVLTRFRMLDILHYQLGKKDIRRIDEIPGKEICRQAHVKAMVIPTIRKFGQLYSIDLKVIDPQKDEFLFSTKDQGKGRESILSMIDRVALDTRKELKEKEKEIQTANQKIADVTTSNFNAYDHYFRGEQFFKQFKFAEAEEQYLKALEIDPDFALAYYRLARIKEWYFGYEYVGEKSLQKALELIGRIPGKFAYLVRALQVRSEKGFKAAIAILENMRQFYPDDEEMLYLLGNMTYRLGKEINDPGRFTTAVTYYEKALAMNPQNIWALSDLRETYETMERYPQMFDIAQRCVSVLPSPVSYISLAASHLKMGKHEMAGQTLQRARQLFPRDYKIVSQIADLYTFREKYDDAEENLKMLTDESQPVEARLFGYLRLADFYPYVGKYRQGINCIDKSIELSLQENDTNSTLFSRIQKAYLLVVGWNDKKNALEEAEKTYPFQDKVQDPSYWIRLAFLYILVGEYTGADNIGSKLDTIPTFRFFYPYIKAVIHCAEMECEKAQPFTHRLVLSGEYAPFRIVLLYWLAGCQFKKGNFHRAAESLREMQGIYYNKFGARANGYPRSFYMLGKIYEAKKDFKRAAANYEKFLDLWKQADNDLPDLIDAGKRLARLKRGE
jgi:serine/threonine protein kinase/tetratricopeptide (TPR) repeat protein